jgi:hypothetical protein
MQTLPEEIRRHVNQLYVNLDSTSTDDYILTLEHLDMLNLPEDVMWGE